MLSQEELSRYHSQLLIKGFGTDAQERLKKSRVVVFGAGGLGCVVSVYLAAAGVGNLRLVDHDTVEPGNLNRQVLYNSGDIGRKKAEIARHRLQTLNPDIRIEPVIEKVTNKNVVRFTEGSDIIVDALDNLTSRYILNQTAVKQGVPLVHGAVSGFEGRVMTVLPRKSACLMCLLKGADIHVRTPVIGVTPAVIGAIQATEVIKYITGLGTLLAGCLLVYDGLSMTFSRINITRNPGCSHCGDRSG